MTRALITGLSGFVWKILLARPVPAVCHHDSGVREIMDPDRGPWGTVGLCVKCAEVMWRGDIPWYRR